MLNCHSLFCLCCRIYIINLFSDFMRASYAISNRNLQKTLLTALSYRLNFLFFRLSTLSANQMVNSVNKPDLLLLHRDPLEVRLAVMDVLILMQWNAFAKYLSAIAVMRLLIHHWFKSVCCFYGSKHSV